MRLWQLTALVIVAIAAAFYLAASARPPQPAPTFVPAEIDDSNTGKQ